MRIRHFIMAWYHPAVHVRRSAWLRAAIRNKRSLFSHFIRAKFAAVPATRKLKRHGMFTRWLFTNPISRRLLGLVGIKRHFCGFCYRVGNPKTAEFKQNFMPCMHCGNFYCRDCQRDLNGLCRACDVPIFEASLDIDMQLIDLEVDYDRMYKQYFYRHESKWDEVERRLQEMAE